MAGRIRSALSKGISSIKNALYAARLYLTMPRGTMFGRNHPAMREIKGIFEGREKVVAWVVGLGGPSLQLGFLHPTEHLEVAEMLRLGRVKDYTVYASDINPLVTRIAEKDLKKGSVRIELARFTNPKVVRALGRIFGFQDPTEKRRAYAKELLGADAEKKTVKFEMPEKTCNSIVLLGRKKGLGNALLETPARRPGLITCFNVAYHYDPEKQRILAENLAKSLAPGGILITETKSMEGAFGDELLRRLPNASLKKVFGVEPTIHYIFRKPPLEKS